MRLLDQARLRTRITAERVAAKLLAATGDEVAWLNSPTGSEDPYAIYARLRAQGPFYRSRLRIWAVPGYHECRELLRDRRFGVQLADGRGPAMLDTLELARGEQGGLSFLEQDPPDHTRLRKLARPAFSPAKLDSYRPMVEKLTHQLLDQALAKGSFDLIADFAGPLPIRVISELLGIPVVDTDRFLRLGGVIAESLDGISSVGQARRLRETTAELYALLGELVERKRAAPGDDVITQLTQSHDEGALTIAELLATCDLLLIAGFETTVNLIGNATLALLDNPEQWALLRERPELAMAASDETLRYDPPVQSTLRVAHEEVELGGRVFAAGSVLLPLLGSTGRDPAAYREPEVFDLTRRPEVDHLAFSGGIHYCLGAPLASLEGEVALRALAERMPDLVRAGPSRRRPSSSIRGLAEFPVRRAPKRMIT